MKVLLENFGSKFGQIIGKELTKIGEEYTEKCEKSANKQQGAIGPTFFISSQSPPELRTRRSVIAPNFEILICNFTPIFEIFSTVM